MATLADELLNDFEDSGSERGDGEVNGFEGNREGSPQNGRHLEPKGAEMLVDGVDEDEHEDGEGTADEEMTNEKAFEDLKNAQYQEEAEARVEKVRLGGVSDVRSVAGLMKTLEPILQVSVFLSPSE